MNDKIEFIKLLLTAILCNALILSGFILIDIDVHYKYYDSAMNSIGFFLLWNVITYVSQHELKRKLGRIQTNLLLAKVK